MTKNVYDHFEAAFGRVSAHAILFEGRKVGTLAIQYPKAGATRLYAYLQLGGTEMVRAFAGGGGYSRRSTAVGKAAREMLEQNPDPSPDLDRHRPLVELLAECGGADQFDKDTYEVPIKGYNIVRAL